MTSPDITVKRIEGDFWFHGVTSTGKKWIIETIIPDLPFPWHNVDPVTGDVVIDYEDELSLFVKLAKVNGLSVDCKFCLCFQPIGFLFRGVSKSSITKIKEKIDSIHKKLYRSLRISWF